MRKFLLLFIALFLITGCSYTPIKINGIVKEHNAIRENHDLNTLTVDKMLNAAAQKHANYMAQQDRLSHYGKNGSRPSDRIKTEGYKYYMVAENIAAGYNTINAVMEGWMESQGHRKNITGKFTHIGTGIAKSANGRWYWCVLFAVPKN